MWIILHRTRIAYNGSYIIYIYKANSVYRGKRIPSENTVVLYVPYIIYYYYSIRYYNNILL